MPDFSALNRMLGRNQDEVTLFDKLDAELEWPEPEDLDAIPPWLGYSAEELDRVRPGHGRAPPSCAHLPADAGSIQSPSSTTCSVPTLWVLHPSCFACPKKTRKGCHRVG